MVRESTTPRLDVRCGLYVLRHFFVQHWTRIVADIIGDDDLGPKELEKTAGLSKKHRARVMEQFAIRNMMADFEAGD